MEWLRTAQDIDFAMLKVTELLLAFPSQAISETGAKARAKAYLMALEDLPSWAVGEACRRWIRGEAGEQNYAFAPSPPQMRSVAEEVAAAIKGHAITMQKLLSAEIEKEYSDEHRSMMLDKLRHLRLAVDKPEKAA